MKKRVLANLEKCYSIAPLRYKEKEHILVAAEKTDRCILFDQEGNEEATVWEGPGGVMTMVQVPGTDGQFLATHQFYSPNDSQNARLVIATPEKDSWKIQTLAELPFVHRFDILESDGQKYLIACTLKSGHAYKDDWSSPGKVYAACLPDDLSSFDEQHQLELEVIKEGMFKNHGYCRVSKNEQASALICSENGVFQFYPPTSESKQWRIEILLETPASDAVLIDLDGDGKEELLVFAPFHGDTIQIYHEQEVSDSYAAETQAEGERMYKLVYEYPDRLEFLHGIWSGELEGKPSVLIGHRKGERDLLKLFWEDGMYRSERVDHNCGPANIYAFHKNGKDYVISANREINEIAMYEV